MNKIVKIVGVGLLVLGLMGCEVVITADPNTGDTAKTWALDTQVADKVEAGAGAVVASGALLSSFLPWLVPFVTAGGAALATWKKIRPKLEKATNERDSYYKGGEVLATALDDIKTNQPDVWAKIAPVIEAATGPVGHVENAIRGFRHLPPK